MATFPRGQSQERRAERTAAILDSAREMLDEMPLETITLNGLARRAELSSSVVLRYFDSHEAVLLALVLEETEEWLREIEGQRVDPGAPLAARRRAAARPLAQAGAEHPRFCGLIGGSAAGLELRVTAATAAAFREASLEQVLRLADWLIFVLPELAGVREPTAVHLAARSVLIVGALWARADHPELVSTQQPFADSAYETLVVFLRGATTPDDF